jgi:hypothetical protein
MVMAAMEPIKAPDAALLAGCIPEPNADRLLKMALPEPLGGARKRSTPAFGTQVGVITEAEAEADSLNQAEARQESPSRTLGASPDPRRLRSVD